MLYSLDPLMRCHRAFGKLLVILDLATPILGDS